MTVKGHERHLQLAVGYTHQHTALLCFTVCKPTVRYCVATGASTDVSLCKMVKHAQFIKLRKLRPKLRGLRDVGSQTTIYGCLTQRCIIEILY